MFVEINGIRKGFGQGDSRVEVLKGISLGIEKGEFCVLLGPSGSGKSTLLNIIGGIDSSDEGYIAIDGEKTANMNEKALTTYRRKHLGYIFQSYNLLPNLTVRENIEVGAYLSDKPLDVDELSPDLVLLDITMPEMDGIGALKAIKAKDPNACVIMCSAMGQQAMVIEAIQAGARDFIVKPFQADRVLEAVRKAVG